MTRVDQFESIFKAASKAVFEPETIDVGKVLVITDLDADGARVFAETTRSFLNVLERDGSLEWREVTGDKFGDVSELLELVESEKPGLICTYRHLHSDGSKWPYSLGEELDVLTQVTPYPVVVLPHPSSERALDHALEDTNRVMAVTDHLTGDHHLVSFALHVTEKAGRLFLTHIEDEATFERFLDIISRVPSIDTDTAREDILERLLKEPRDYIRSCRETLEPLPESVRRSVQIEEIVTLGHRLSDYKRLIEEHEIDLLVFNTKDEDQLAMHGLAYPLAVEMRQIPLLMI